MSYYSGDSPSGGNIFKRAADQSPRSHPKCMACKHRTEPQSGNPYLFLIPLWDGRPHDESIDYFLQNMHPIASYQEIPTGQRACRVRVFRCPKCNNKIVQIDDFLKVRTQEALYDQYLFDYDPFEDLLLHHDPMDSMEK